MCTDLLRRIVGLGLAGLLVLPLAGCTVEGPGSWRYRGDPLLQAEKDLAAITEVWREHVRTERGPRALPADSACYLRISAPHDVDDEVVCGPLIVRGPRWESASIASYYERDGKVALTLTGSPEDAFSPVADAELGAVRAADGTAPDSTATPIAPVLPTLQPGEVRPLAAVEDPGEDPFEDPDPDHDDGFRLIDATDRFLVARLRPVDPSSADNAAIDVVAPEGHRLMVVEVTDLSADPTTQDQVVPTTLTIRAGDDAAPQVVEVPGATAPGTSDGNTEDPARGRWVAAVPAGQEVHLDLSDGDHVASAGSAPGDLTNDFPRTMAFTGDPQTLGVTVERPGEGIDGKVVVGTDVEIRRNTRTHDGPSTLAAVIRTREPSRTGPDAGSEGPLRWFRGGSAIAGYTSSTVTLVDPVLEVDGVAHPVRAETDDLTGDPMVQESIFIAPEAEARLTLRGTLRIELSQPIAVPGPGYDGTVPEGVPGSAVVELPMEQGVGIAPVVGDGGLRQAW